MLIFQHSRPGRRAQAQAPKEKASLDGIPEHLRRRSRPRLPEVSELQAVRHYTKLSQKNFSIDTQFYPLGSCTMKYNPRACHSLATLPGLLNRHPLAPESHSQGFLSAMHELQEILKEVTGMAAVSLSPMAGAQGEFAGVAMIRAYHDSRNDDARTEILVPDAAHGTNPATATMCGYTVREIPTDAEGDVDVEALRAAVGPHTAGIMLTNPSTLGVFERRITGIAAIVHAGSGDMWERIRVICFGAEPPCYKFIRAQKRRFHACGTVYSVATAQEYYCFICRHSPKPRWIYLSGHEFYLHGLIGKAHRLDN